MNDRPHRGYPWWERPQAFWALLAVGLLALVAVVLGGGMIPRGDDGRKARSEQLETQARTAEAAQKSDAAEDAARRSDLMN